MKFNKLVLVLILALMSVTVFGCSNSGSETAQKAQGNNETASESQKVALPEEKPAFFGKVKEIVGNEVTVYIGQVAQNNGTQKEPANQTQNQTQNPNQTQNQNQPNSGANPGNRGFRMNFTEETKTFIIPVGTPIATMQRGSKEANQVGLTEIKKDTVLRVWEKDGSVSFVLVAGGNGAMRRQGAGSNGAGAGYPPGMGGGPAGMGGNR